MGHESPTHTDEGLALANRGVSVLRDGTQLATNAHEAQMALQGVHLYTDAGAVGRGLGMEAPIANTLVRSPLPSVGMPDAIPRSPLRSFGAGLGLAGGALQAITGVRNGARALHNGDGAGVRDSAFTTARGLTTAISGGDALRGGTNSRALGTLGGALEIGQGLHNRHTGGDTQQGRLASDDPSAQGRYQLWHGAASIAGTRPGAWGIAGRAAGLGLNIGNNMVRAAEQSSVDHADFGRDSAGNEIDSSTAAANEGNEVQQYVGHGQLGAIAGGAATVGQSWLNTAEVAGNRIGDWASRVF